MCVCVCVCVICIQGPKRPEDLEIQVSFYSCFFDLLFFVFFFVLFCFLFSYSSCVGVFLLVFSVGLDLWIDIVWNLNCLKISSLNFIQRFSPLFLPIFSGIPAENSQAFLENSL